MRNIGIVLVVAGVAALVYGGFTYPRHVNWPRLGTGGDHRRRAEELPRPGGCWFRGAADRLRARCRRQSPAAAQSSGDPNLSEGASI